MKNGSGKEDKYSAIRNMEYKGSTRKTKLSPEARAAQFAPFAALTGFDDSIKEAGKNLITFIVASAVVLGLLAGSLGTVKAYGEGPFFKDVIDESDFWFTPAYWGANNGIVMGYNDGTFGPEKQCTRAQMVTFIWRLAGKPEPSSDENPFSDIKSSDYFYKACLWGNENEIVMGYNDGTFRPSNKCLRNQAVTFLWRFAGKPEPSTEESPFKDIKESDYFYKAVLWGAEMKIVAGYPSEGKFKPKGECLRRQMVTFLYKFARTATDGKFEPVSLLSDLTMDADYDKDQMADARTIDTPQIIRGASVNGGIKIIWEEMMGYNVNYHLYRKDESSDWKKIKTLTSTSYLDKDVKSGKEYTYRLTASVVKGEESPYSEAKTYKYTKVSSKYAGFTDYCISLMDTKGNDYSDGSSLVKYYEKPFIPTDESGRMVGDNGVFMYRSTVVPYKSGGASLKGMDCLGLQTFLAKSYFGISLTQSRSQYLAGKVISVDEIRPGDLLCVGPGYNPDHGYTYMYCGKDPETGYDLVMTTNKRHCKLYMIFFDVEAWDADEGKCIRRITK
ncbi:MAG: S-layer homology domain-containing protein [Clostridiales bacterium]|nr:S-layer homology domain-containing protein [Clostridiales bacterium]